MDRHVKFLLLCCISIILLNKYSFCSQILNECSINSHDTHCIENDTSMDSHHQGEDVTVIVIIRLPIRVLTEVFLDESTFAIVTLGGETIITGQHVLRNQDMHRWKVDLKFQHINNSEQGRLIFNLYIRELLLIDEQHLHLEINTGKDATFKTQDHTWLQMINQPTDVQEAGPSTEEEYPKTTLPSTTEHRGIDLESKLDEVERKLEEYRTKYERCLETSKKPIVLDVVVFLIVISLSVGITVFAVSFKKNNENNVDTCGIDDMGEECKLIQPGWKLKIKKGCPSSPSQTPFLPR